MSESHVEIREVGTVVQVKRGIVKLAGLPSCILGQLIELGDGLRAFVIGFTDSEVMALTLGNEANLTVGDRVDVRRAPLRAPVGDQLIGRVVSPLGAPLDGRPAPETKMTGAVFQDAPGVMLRSPVERYLHTGVKILDAMVPIGRGQRELIIGDRMTGKTAIALDAILSQKDHGVICIYCCIGQSQQKLEQVVRLLRQRASMAYTVVVAAPASCEASAQFLAPYAACAAGEHFMRHGQDVLVVFDDLSKHAWAYRQISLLLDRSPGREAYPGDMFYVHAQLMERAGQLCQRYGGGSMTFFPICETQQGDVTGHISSNLISMTDGQIYLSTALFYEGTKPAIDVGLSVSRIGNKVQPNLLRWASSEVRLELIQHQELVRLTRFAGAGSERMAERKRRGELLKRLMAQGVSQPAKLQDEIFLLCAAKAGWLERITEEGIDCCLRGLTERMPAFALDALRENQEVSPALIAKLDAALEEILRPYLLPHTGEKSNAISAAAS